MINNKVTKLVLDNLEQKIQEDKFTPKSKNGLSKVEGILTSSIQLKHEVKGVQNGWSTYGSYYLAFFQLEGLEQDIPVIFKIDSSANPDQQTPPYIPPRAKVLLEGHWAEPTNSNRPSFTCLAWEIITNPPPITIKSLQKQINHLLITSLEKQTEWKQRVDYLFKRLKYLKDLDQLTKLGDQYLQAYLLLKSASYANYQDNLLPHTTDLTNYDHYLTKLQSEIEEVAQQVRAYQSKDMLMKGGFFKTDDNL